MRGKKRRDGGREEVWVLGRRKGAWEKGKEGGRREGRGKEGRGREGRGEKEGGREGRRVFTKKNV